MAMFYNDIEQDIIGGAVASRTSDEEVRAYLDAAQHFTHIVNYHSDGWPYYAPAWRAASGLWKALEAHGRGYPFDHKAAKYSLASMRRVCTRNGWPKP